jgi:hypothetical protein
MANYLTPAEAQLLADDRLNVEAWDDAVTADGSNFGDTGTECYKALSEATRIINRLWFRGEKYDAAQANQFPRGTDTTVPEDITIACFEIALSLLDGINPQLEAENLAMISQGYANVRSTYDRTVSAPHISAGVPSLTAWRYLAPYLRSPYFVDVNRTS